MFGCRSWGLRQQNPLPSRLHDATIHGLRNITTRSSETGEMHKDIMRSVQHASRASWVLRASASKMYTKNQTRKFFTLGPVYYKKYNYTGPSYTKKMSRSLIKKKNEHMPSACQYCGMVYMDERYHTKHDILARAFTWRSPWQVLRRKHITLFFYDRTHFGILVRNRYTLLCEPSIKHTHTPNSRQDPYICPEYFKRQCNSRDIVQNSQWMHRRITRKIGRAHV